MESIRGHGEILNPLFHENSSVKDSCPSDCESGTSIPAKDLIKMSQGEKLHVIIKKKLLSSFISAGFNAHVESIQRINFSSNAMKRAKFQSFCLYSKAMEIKCGGDSNMKYAWYGASMADISSILSYGFSLRTMSRGPYGHGVYLSPLDHPIESLQPAVADEDRAKHTMLLCRVILGKPEVVSPGSKQHGPISEEFDSGLIDGFAVPKKYIVWASNMNTHILPQFAVSFRASPLYCRGSLVMGQSSSILPRSSWVPFPALIGVLSEFLPSDAVEEITKRYVDFKKGRISRHDMIQMIRNTAGDNLLASIIKSYRGKARGS